MPDESSDGTGESNAGPSAGGHQSAHTPEDSYGDDTPETGTPTADGPEGSDAVDGPPEARHPEGGESAARSESGSTPGGRDVVVPLRLYKTVTVFSTLIAVVTILAGFVLLDRGTQRATASPDEVSLPVVALGLALIVAGSAVYAFATRFRTAGMGKSKDDTDELSDNG